MASNRFNRFGNVIVCGALLGTITLVKPSAATTITVGQGGGYDHETIQAGIDAATTGDTVVVYPGTYIENIHFDGKNIVLRSTDPTDTATVAATIVDGNAYSSVVEFSDTETSDCVLAGFTIRNGGTCGIGGIGTHALIEFNVIRDNGAPQGPGVSWCDGTIRYNTITGNRGGGLDYCHGRIHDNAITSNTAGYGAGLWGCQGTIENNLIRGNSAGDFGGFGGGLSNCNGTIRNNVISDNYASIGGAGLDSCTGLIENNVIHGNTIPWTGGVGGGLYECNGTIQNNVITSNSAGTGGGLFSCGGTIRMNTIRWNSAQSYGGGVRNCSGTIQDNMIADNSAVYAGGGLYFCDGTIEKNTITSNTSVFFGGGGLDQCDGTIKDNTISRNSSDGPGGGLNSCNGTIQDNTIRHNSAGHGGGLSGCGGLIRDNRIVSNSAASGAGLSGCNGTITGNLISDNSTLNAYSSSGHRDGGGLERCNGTIENNAITSNSAALRGGGLSECDGTIRGNLIAGNWARNHHPSGAGGGWGGALFICSGTIENNVITGNWAELSGGGLYDCDGRIVNNTITNNSIWSDYPAVSAGGGLYYCSATIANCVIWGNYALSTGTEQLTRCSTPTYSCIQGWTSGGEGNIASDPLFVDPDGPDDDPGTYEDNDFRLVPASPCVDAGNPAPEYNDAARPPGLGAERNDMGAYGGPSNGAWLVVDLTGNLSSVGPTPIICGEPIVLSGSVINQGVASATSPVWIEFWAINRQTGWAGYLCDSILEGPLDVGESVDLANPSRPRIAYDRIPSGVYTIEMRIDATDAIAELDEANNLARYHACEIQPNRPNLTVAGFDFSPQDIDTTDGNSITLRLEIENTGSQPTAGALWAEFRVWPVAPLNAPSIYLCDSYHGTQSLAAGETLALSQLVRTTYAIPPGVYRVGVILDPLDQVAEQREDDNVTWLPRKKLYVGPRPTDAANWELYR